MGPAFLGWLGFLGLIVASYVGGAQTRPSGDEILKKIDDNRVTGNKIILSEMVIHGRRGTRTILIAGHMLRQSVIGSDLSYEDVMEDPVLGRSYEARVDGEEAAGERACWILQLTAKIPNVAYYSRKLWVDKERFVVLRRERFASGGKLLKTTDVRSVHEVQYRWIPDRIVFKDVLQSGDGTEFTLTEIALDVPIPETVFSKASLKQ